MEKRMKNVFADRISAGSAGYSLREFTNDLMAAIASDKYLIDPKDQSFHFDIYYRIIYMMAVGHDDPKE
jgi:hypothetical protein